MLSAGAYSASCTIGLLLGVWLKENLQEFDVADDEQPRIADSPADQESALRRRDFPQAAYHIAAIGNKQLLLQLDRCYLLLLVRPALYWPYATRPISEAT